MDIKKDLHDAIMNLSCDDSKANDEYSDRRNAYYYGYLDARLAAAELALTHPVAAVAPVAIPAGYALTTIEPTNSMLAAYICHSEIDDPGRLCPVGYKAAIAASPSPAAQDAATGEQQTITQRDSALRAEPAVQLNARDAMLSALRKAVVALAHASDNPLYMEAYEAASNAIEAEVASRCRVEGANTKENVPVELQAAPEQGAQVPSIAYPTTYADLARLTPLQLWNRWRPQGRTVSAREAFIAAREIPFSASVAVPIGKKAAAPDRKVTLLKAAYELLSKQREAGEVLNLLAETVFYDDADCDGGCLLEDIEIALNDQGARSAARQSGRGV